MKAVFIRPPKTRGELEKSSVQHPINLAGLAAYLRTIGVEVQIWDFEVEPSNDESIKTMIEQFKPDMVGLTCLSATFSGAKRIASIAKKQSPDALIILGGPHATAVPQETLDSSKEFDVIVLGEGEQTALEICYRLIGKKSLEDVPGLAFRQDGKITINKQFPPVKPLDLLPHPARELLKLDLYVGVPTFGLHRKGLKGTELFTSRGCPEDCIFCSLPRVMGGKAVRFRSSDHVLAEVEECINKFGFNHFTIEDDTFTLSKSRLDKICNGFKKLGVTYDCDTRVDFADLDVFKLLKETGCLKVAMGVESGSPRILELIKKRITPDQVIEAFRNAQKVNLMNQAFFIVGSHPSETMEDIKMSMKLIRKINPDFAVINIMTPFPGTELFDIMKERGLLNNINYDKFDCLHGKPDWRTEIFSGDELIKIQKKLYLYYVLNPSYIMKVLKKIVTIDGFKYYLSSGIGFFKYLFKEARV
jgi:anaerobic magnesium-protoporphyrin IX monomethyl ester cyclase